MEDVTSEIRDPTNICQVKSNFPKEELEALKKLIKLQKERKIVIKQCDKGAGLVILNFDDYMKAAENHLSETKGDEEGNYKPY